MTQHQNEHQYDDGARLARRYNGADCSCRVTFGPFALLVGTGVTHILLAAAVGVAFTWSMPSSAFSIAVLAAILGLPFAVVGCVLALVLGLALRPVASQILHVAAFFGAFTFLSALITLMSGDGMGALVTGAVVGAAAAIGRASVWKLVTVHPKKPATTEHRAE